MLYLSHVLARFSSVRNAWTEDRLPVLAESLWIDSENLARFFVPAELIELLTSIASVGHADETQRQSDGGQHRSRSLCPVG
jgi:hypothetical protein